MIVRRVAASMFALALGCPASGTRDELPPAAVFTTDGGAFDPLTASVPIVVLAFVTPDCPISNRYAPELRRIASTLPPDRVGAWLVYPDPDVAADAIERHRSEYALPWPALRDPEHRLVSAAQARVTPEVAVFVRADDGTPVLAYHGRIDDRVPEFGRIRAQASEHDLEDALAAILGGEAPPRASAVAVGCPIDDLR